jgi:hypothetical protein
VQRLVSGATGLAAVWLAAALGAAMSESEARPGAFVEALLARDLRPPQRERVGLYDSLIGSWDIELVDYLPDGTQRKSAGEWHFAQVLEGRAVQDVFIVPPRTARGPELPGAGNRYGTTLRFYDPKLDAWRVTWLNPVSGATNTLVGRRRGEEIVQEGADTDGSRIRWTFSEIGPRSFRWRGEVSADDGKSWRLVVEFFGRRRE